MLPIYSSIDKNIHITTSVIESTEISLINTPDSVKSLLVKSVCMHLHNMKRWIQRSNQIMYIVFKGKKKKEKILTLIFEVTWILLIAWKGWKNRIMQGIGRGSLSVWVCVCVWCADTLLQYFAQVKAALREFAHWVLLSGSLKQSSKIRLKLWEATGCVEFTDFV